MRIKGLLLKLSNSDLVIDVFQIRCWLRRTIFTLCLLTAFLAVCARVSAGAPPSVSPVIWNFPTRFKANKITHPANSHSCLVTGYVWMRMSENNAITHWVNIGTASGRCMILNMSWLSAQNGYFAALVAVFITIKTDKMLLERLYWWDSCSQTLVRLTFRLFPRQY
jgi:hypothetical protein